MTSTIPIILNTTKTKVIPNIVDAETLEYNNKEYKLLNEVAPYSIYTSQGLPDVVLYKNTVNPVPKTVTSKLSKNDDNKSVCTCHGHYGNVVDSDEKKSKVQLWPNQGIPVEVKQFSNTDLQSTHLEPKNHTKSSKMILQPIKLEANTLISECIPVEGVVNQEFIKDIEKVFNCTHKDACELLINKITTLCLEVLRNGYVIPNLGPQNIFYTKRINNVNNIIDIKVGTGLHHKSFFNGKFTICRKKDNEPIQCSTQLKSYINKTTFSVKQELQKRLLLLYEFYLNRNSTVYNTSDTSITLKGIHDKLPKNHFLNYYVYNRYW